MEIYNKLKQFYRCEKGVNAIEFAIVAPLFLVMVFSIIEVGFLFMTDLALESALINASRAIRTGQAMTNGTSESAFKSEICSRTYGLINCSKLKVQAMVFNSFGEGNNLPPLKDSDGKLINESLFQIGNSDSIIIVRSTYVYDVLNPLGEGIQLSNYGDNQYLHVHITAFKNEPF